MQIGKTWSLPLVGLFIAAGCGTTNKAACERVEELCASKGSPMVTVTVKCEPDGFDDMSNADEVKDCIDAAPDCLVVAQCLAKAKK